MVLLRLGGVLPLVAGSTPVRGYIVINSWVRTWMERVLEFERKRMVVRGLPPAVIADRMRKLSELSGAYVNEPALPGDVLKRRPALASVWDEPGTHQYGRPARFYQQLQALNLEDAWSRVRQPTLVSSRRVRHRDAPKRPRAHDIDAWLKALFT